MGKAREAAKSPAMHRTGPRTKNDFASNVNRATIEKRWYRVSRPKGGITEGTVKELVKIKILFAQLLMFMDFSQILVSTFVRSYKKIRKYNTVYFRVLEIAITHLPLNSQTILFSKNHLDPK